MLYTNIYNNYTIRYSSVYIFRYFSTSANKNGLRSRILGLVFPDRSATVALQSWVDDGNRVSASELRRISTELVKFRRYRHVLEIITWMEAQHKFQLSATDHTMRVDLIIKEQSIAEAEKYFANIPSPASKISACLPLLHFYVKERATDTAEALMLKMNKLGLIVSNQPLNEMMKLYAATSQFEKVVSVIQHMNKNKIPKNVLSYNLWMTACSEVSGVASAETIYKKMAHDSCVEVGWSSLATLANIYIKSGLFDKATWALKTAEKKLSARNRLAYLFLMTLYASLNNKDGVLRLWEASKQVDGKMTCANYISILSSLVKLCEIEEAEKIFTEWESQCRTYDIRVSNILLGVYMRSGSTEKAEALHTRTLERGGRPNYKTWEILMEGWVKNQDMEKAVNAMEKGFAMLPDCKWRPSPSIIATISEYFERTGDVEGALRYLELIRRYGFASLPAYKSALRLFSSNQRPIFHDIVAMMKKDNIEFDDEVSILIQSTVLQDKYYCVFGGSFMWNA